MKNYLLKIASLSVLSIGLLLSACSDSDDNDNNAEETLLTDECLLCPFYSLKQTTASNPEPVIISEPEGTVCKGTDGKAYIDGVINEADSSYEDYLELRQSRLPCTIIE